MTTRLLYYFFFFFFYTFFVNERVCCEEKYKGRMKMRMRVQYFKFSHYTTEVRMIFLPINPSSFHRLSLRSCIFFFLTLSRIFFFFSIPITIALQTICIFHTPVHPRASILHKPPTGEYKQPPCIYY